MRLKERSRLATDRMRELTGYVAAAAWFLLRLAFCILISARAVAITAPYIFQAIPEVADDYERVVPIWVGGIAAALLVCYHTGQALRMTGQVSRFIKLAILSVIGPALLICAWAGFTRLIGFEHRSLRWITATILAGILTATVQSFFFSEKQLVPVNDWMQHPFGTPRGMSMEAAMRRASRRYSREYKHEEEGGDEETRVA